jgi:hypothetical protein
MTLLRIQLFDEPMTATVLDADLTDIKTEAQIMRKIQQKLPELLKKHAKQLARNRRELP